MRTDDPRATPGAKPGIAGRRIAVERVVTGHTCLGYSADEIASGYDLEPADVYAALAYYFAHREEIDPSTQEGEDFARRLREETPSLLEEKLGRCVRPHRPIRHLVDEQGAKAVATGLRKRGIDQSWLRSITITEASFLGVSSA